MGFLSLLIYQRESVSSCKLLVFSGAWGEGGRALGLLSRMTEHLRWLVSFLVVFNSLLVGIEAQWGLENLSQVGKPGANREQGKHGEAVKGRRGGSGTSEWHGVAWSGVEFQPP